MKRALLLFAIGCGSATATQPKYPAVARGPIADDPYRALEQMDAPATSSWAAAENALTDATLKDAPGKREIHDRLVELYSRAWFVGPEHRGSHYFWSKHDATHDQATIETATSLDGEATTLLDPTEFSKDGSLQVARWESSQDGALVAYGLASGGGDWTTWRFRDSATGKDLPDELPFMKYYVPAFTADHAGVYYSRFPAPEKGKELTEADHDCRLYFHRFGTPVADDKLVFERKDQPSWQFEPHTTFDGKYLVIAIGDGEVGDSRQEQIAIVDLSSPNAAPVTVVDKFAAEYEFIGGIGSGLYFLTDAGAPTKKIAMIDAGAPTAWRDIVPAGAHAIEDATLAGGNVVVHELVDVHSAIAIYDATGAKLRDAELPSIGAAYLLPARPDEAEAYYLFTSFTVPYTTYRLDLATGKSTPWRAPSNGFDETAYETKQLFFPAQDGTKVPMFVTSKKGLVLDGTHPTLMYGYGFGGISSLPTFSPRELVWIEHGGVAVTVNVRGGGEYGDAWHNAGAHANTHVRVDDFIAAAEYLIAQKYTSPEHLGIYGYSGGGLLVGATLVKRPDLFGAAAPIAGVLDLLRFHLFGQGAGWQADLGHPGIPAEAAWLRAISPLHNVRAGTHYPATYIVTSDHDVRVAPLHSYKFAAAMQAAQAGPAPILLRVDVESGHGGGGLRSQEIEQNTELLVFFAKYLGLPM
ncbi:MAG TPA: prolyl oligopeptidase family serine peptidase [Kofleriaceae bacterium]|jgi:prolyl oligopeptidase